MQQGTQDWLDFRRTKIGSSEAAAIMGVSPWKTPYQLWKQKIEGTSDPVNQAMKRGIILEAEALKLFSAKMNIYFKPDVIVSEERPWQIASLDGISDDRSLIVEIKCGGADLHDKALIGVIPVYYMAQIQHQISVVNPLKAFYCSFNGQEIVIIEVNPDVNFIKEMLDKEEKFWELLVNNEPPPLCDRDYELFEHSRGSEILREYISLGIQEKEIKKRKDAMKEELIEIGPKRNFILDGVKVYQTQNTSYDTKRMREDGIGVEKYKKLSNPYWMISSPRNPT